MRPLHTRGRLLSFRETTEPDAVAGAHWIPPQEFDEYRLMGQLGQGGMGQVWLAQDTLLDRPVAVKFIASIEPDALARERFLIEARAIARLQHPNVAAVHRVGLVEGRPYLVSELIRGQTLSDIPVPLRWQKVLHLGVGLARGLAAAHRRGVLHRDLKPANAMLTEGGEVKLLDFGLAKLLESEPQDAPASGPPTPPPAMVSADADKTLVLLGAHTLQELASAPGPNEGTWRSVTRPGELLGTPHYIAPEIWQGALATARSDVYSLGVILFYLSTGRHPHNAQHLPGLVVAVSTRDAPSLAALVTGMDPDLAAIVDRCLRREPGQRFSSGDEVREALERLTPEGRLTSVPEGNPYRGLQTFQSEHRSLFFGRDAEMRALLERLRSEPLLLVTGDSGVGKSSLCRAGVLPLVASGSIDDQRSWSIVSFVPGKYPRAALTAALAPVLALEEHELEQRMAKEPTAVPWLLRKRIRAGAGLLVYVDQLEELVTLADPDEAAQVAGLLSQLLVLKSDCRVLGTVRQDFLTRIAALPGIGEEVSRALYVLRPLTAEAIRQAVVGPARVKGFAFESEQLIEQLVSSTAGMEGGLPLLQFTLHELWEARDPERQVIPAARLQAMGGVEGALSRHADGVLAALLPAERCAARKILMQLVTPGGTRARRTETELARDPDTRAALEALVRGRLVVALSSEHGTAHELAHEALIRGWQTLRSWLSQEAESHAAKHRLQVAAGEWERLGRTPEALWGTRQLAEASALELPALAPREQAFLEQSHGSVHKRRLAKRALATVIPVVIALTYGGVRWKADRDLGRQIQSDLVMAKSAWTDARAKDARVEQLRREAFAQFDRREREAGERSWSLALGAAGENERGFARANEWFEKALALDSGRRSVRSAFADFLYDRALLAEREGRSAQLGELLQRLQVYDDGGARMGRWNAPAHLEIATSPAGAEVLLERYQSDSDGRRPAVLVGRLGQTPLAEVELAPGSYRLTLTAPGRAPVRYPVLLRRAERLPVQVSLPRASEIPAGFVYVPLGRFQFGSADDERARVGFFNTVPLHESSTRPYLIARTETTYAEYIDYLRALAPEERMRRMPRIRQTSMLDQRSLELKETEAGDWLLRFQPTTRPYSARLGERIKYDQRRLRAVQDWRRFPVSGISATDAEAYAKWLRETGRVPGARLCTEKEWERAGRGADDRPFPHGDRLHPDDANYDETYGKAALAFGPDEVGSHPASRAPFDTEDVAGNVWEWTSSSLAPGYAVRGGGYYHGSITNMIYNRQDPEPTFRDMLVGVRLCADFSSR